MAAFIAPQGTRLNWLDNWVSDCSLNHNKIVLKIDNYKTA